MKPNNDLTKLRHSAAHLLAHAVEELFPNTKPTIGPATPDGFFYDFLPEKNFKEEDLTHIEKKMRDISKQDLTISHEQISKAKAYDLYSNNPFKRELIDTITGETVGIARQGNFYDLCKGGHVSSTGKIIHFKLLGISGSYWRADKKQQSLQRITGTAFFSQQALEAFDQKHEDSLRYDHRRLGKELDLFSFHEEGIGFPFFHPHGTIIITLLKQHLRTLLMRAHYQEITTPIMLNNDLWKQSKHYQHYKKHMYFCTIDEKIYAIRPMNCPGAVLIYKQRPYSYRELPLRLAEFGLVHRYELSGVLHGLFRTRAFTIDDAHIFCTQEQIEQEVLGIITMTYTLLKQFNFDAITIGIATKPENTMGSDLLWKKATDALAHAVEKAGYPYEYYEGEGAFYGPKIEFRIKDSMGREWQCSTIQVDFFLPKNFNLSYIDSSGNKQQPAIIHRAIYGSLERFFGIILEHYLGKLPFWLSPVQATILTITDKQNPYAQTILQHLTRHSIRARMDKTSDPIAGKIKKAQIKQIPWMIIIGAKEESNKTVTLRYRDGSQKSGLSIDQLMQHANHESIML